MNYFHIMREGIHLLAEVGSSVYAIFFLAIWTASTDLVKGYGDLAQEKLRTDAARILNLHCHICFDPENKGWMEMQKQVDYVYQQWREKEGKVFSEKMQNVQKRHAFWVSKLKEAIYFVLGLLAIDLFSRFFIASNCTILFFSLSLIMTTLMFSKLIYWCKDE